MYPYMFIPFIVARDREIYGVKLIILHVFLSSAYFFVN